MLIDADSNARGKTWYDIITKQRGKALEEFLTIRNLNIVNLRTEPKFEATRFNIYVDLTIVNNQMLRRVTDWICGIN